MNKEDLHLIIKIAERAENMGLFESNRLNFTMDLEYANEKFKLKLEELLNANESDFFHDIHGIQRHINRQTKQFENCFVPRFAGKN